MQSGHGRESEARWLRRSQVALNTTASNQQNASRRVAEFETHPHYHHPVMPSHVPAELKLDEPVYEEDICDVSPYAVLPLSTTSTTINSSLGGYSPRSIQPEDDVPMSGHDMYHMLSRTPKRGLFGSLPSSSLQTHDKQPLKLQMELDSLGVDPVAIAKMQRWVLGIAVGVYLSNVLLLGSSYFSSRI